MGMRTLRTDAGNPVSSRCGTNVHSCRMPGCNRGDQLHLLFGGLFGCGHWVGVVHTRTYTTRYRYESIQIQTIPNLLDSYSRSDTIGKMPKKPRQPIASQKTSIYARVDTPTWQQLLEMIRDPSDPVHFDRSASQAVDKAIREYVERHGKKGK